MPSAVLRRDWHQFKLLSRDAVRQLIDTALFSRDADPMQFALWMLALVATPPTFFAARQIFLYTALKNAPLEVVERVALGHRLFFVTYAMLAAVLLAALLWESLFPDGRDQEIVGVLPVRPHTYAAARLGAATAVGVAFAAAINVPAAIVYTAVSSTHPALRNIPGLLIGQVIGTMLGALFVFFALLSLRGLTAIVLGARAGAWLGAGLQLLTVVLLVEVVFFLPGVLSQLGKAMLSGDPSANALPPVWFAAMHAWIAGSAHPVVASGAQWGVLAFVMATGASLPIYLLPARWLGRRALHSRPRQRAGGVTMVVKGVARVAAARPVVRGIFVFAVASLLRSRRHLLVLSTYVGMAIAICIISILVIEVRGTYALETPGSWVLALPMVCMFFVVLGLRATFRIPTEIEANWPFRLSQPSLPACANAAALVMFALGVLPMALTLFIALVVLWPIGDAVVATLLQLLAGVFLIECALAGWVKVPFACSHAPSPNVLKAWWPVYTLAMYLYAFKLSNWQFAALSSSTALGLYVGILAAGIVAARLFRYGRLRKQSLEFDVQETGSVERLNLSEALD